MLKLLSPRDGAEVSLQTEAQAAFARGAEERANIDGALTYHWDDLHRQGIDRTLPLPLHFVWEEESDAYSAERAYSYLLISEREDMEAARVYGTDELFCDVYNLKVGTEYFWCVQKNGRRSEVFSFRTLRTLPRCLKIDSISNFRDMGGYAVEEGVIRQGLLFRGGELELHMHLTPSGGEEFSRLGIRTEVDMRGEAENTVERSTAELFGARRIFIPSSPYYLVFDKEERGAIRKFYKVFTDRKNYPIYFHCWGGADRTGTAAFILGAFLGMRYEDLIYEYEFTSLAVWGIRTRNFKDFVRFLELFSALEGDSLREKATVFLREIAGLTDRQLITLYDILVEKN